MSECNEDLAELGQEIKNLRKLLWAAAMSAGGKLAIEDRHIHRATDDCRLHRYDDAGLSRVVLTAQTEAY
ncbi:MAG: hypothetical protein CMN85_10420 [Spongiibacteraceae bacterium]|nr:hypothetical protein [Spongiibacteraceae bacterium]|tara:strand:+ start:5825 stop:6034 length:210 start_codon:yes stop_codon:yes gene_type:complete